MLFLLLVAILAASILVVRRTDRIALGVSAIVLISLSFVLAMAIAACYLVTLVEIEQFKAFEDTLAGQRDRLEGSEMERAAVVIKIAEWNEWLAKCRYWDGIPACEQFIPDAVRGLAPIR